MSQIFIDSVTGEVKYQGSSGTPGILADSSGNVPLIPCKINYNLVSYLADCTQSTFQSMGSVLFDPSAIYSGSTKITRAISFDALIYGSSSVTSEIRLYNVTDAAVVSGTTLSSAASTSPVKVTAPLTITSIIPNSEKQYEIQMKISLPALVSPGDFAFCSYAAINVLYS